MSYLAGKTIVPQMWQSIAVDTAAYAIPQRDYNKVTHTMSGTKRLFSQRHCMCIVAKCNSQSKTVTQHSSQRNNAFPWHIGSIFDTTCTVVSTWSTDTHRADAFIPAIRLHQIQNVFAQNRQIVSDIWVLRGHKEICCYNFATDIDNTYRGPFQTDVYSNDARFCGILNHNECVLSKYYAAKIVNNFLSTKDLCIFLSSL